MFEKFAIDLFYERAVRQHAPLRLLGAATIGGVLIELNLVGSMLVVAWLAALLGGEAGLRLWRRIVVERAETSALRKAALRQLIALAAIMSALWVAPALIVFDRGGDIGADVGLVLCSAIFLVVCAQHNMSRWMFYTSGFGPGLGLTLNMVYQGGEAHPFAMATLAFAVLANARNLHHAGVETFKGLVIGKLEVEEANVHLQTALEEAQQASAAKSTFLATMSHELRTPLNGIIGMAEALTLRGADPKVASGLEVIGKSGKALMAILNDVLDISKIEAGRLELSAQPFELAAVVEEVSALFTVAAQEKGVVLSTDVAEAAGVYCGDAARVRQILANLVANAVKFTPSGVIDIGVRSLDGDDMLITVRDSGIGMEPAALARLFTRFTQADGSITRQYGGTGLGLAICRELCELMGGEISAESRVGQGATVSVRLPLPRLADAAPAAAAPTATPTAMGQAEPPRALRVLCAEDNAINQLVLRTLLEQFGCEPVMAENGELALELWRSGAWDVVLMDMQMPVMDGLTATRALRREEAASGRPRTPVIAVTADALADQVSEQRQAGADLHLAKPIQAAALLEALSAALALEEEGRPETQVA